MTPPGEKVQCRKHRFCEGNKPGCERYGRIGSRDDAANWHASLGERHNRFLTALRRGEGSPKVKGHLVPIEDLDYFNGREVQEQRAERYGVELLHQHLVLRRSSGLPFVLSEAKVRRLLVEHGFGRKFTLKGITGDGAASYLTKRLALYVSKSVCVRVGVETVKDGEVVRWAGRLWTTSRAWAGAGTTDVVRLAVGEPLVSFKPQLCGLAPALGAGELLGTVLATFKGSEVVQTGPPGLWSRRKEGPWHAGTPGVGIELGQGRLCI